MIRQQSKVVCRLKNYRKKTYMQKKRDTVFKLVKNRRENTLHQTVGFASRYLRKLQKKCWITVSMQTTSKLNTQQGQYQPQDHKLTSRISKHMSKV